MRRLVLTLVTVVIVVGLTASVAMSAMRITSISFRAVTTLEGGLTTLTAASDDSLAMTTASIGSSDRTEQGSCAESCLGLFLQVDGTLVGLGEAGETIVVVEATGVPVVSCTNAGGTMSPGQNPPRVSTSGQQQIGVTQITKNGAARIDVTTGLPDGTIPGSQLGCPNDTWTADIVGIQFTNATVTVFQDGVMTFQESYAF